MKTTLKRMIPFVLIAAIILNAFGGSITFADDDGDSPSTINDVPSLEQTMIDRFGVTEDFIQQQLSAGYTLNQINSALWKASLDHISYEDALKSLFPKSLNLSQSVSGDVYNQLADPLVSSVNFFTEDESSAAKATYGDADETSVAETTYANSDIGGKDGASVLDSTYGTPRTRSLATAQPPVLENPPVYNLSSISQAPYSIGDNGESYSSLSGGLSVTQTDMTLPGRGGMSFSLVRQYDTDSARFYDMSDEAVTHPYTIYNYAVSYSAIQKPVLTRYDVKYIENQKVQEDYDGNGSVDYETSYLYTNKVNYGSYNTEDAAKQAKASIKYPSTMPSDTLIWNDYRTSSTTTGFPSYIPIPNQNGYSGTLYTTGSPYVISGSYIPQASKTATDSCTNSIPGQYDSKGNWFATGTGGSCPSSKSYNSDGYTGTLSRTTTDTVKACLSPGHPGYICTKTFVANYSGTVTKPGSDTRVWRQDYSGYLKNPGNSSPSLTKYGSWSTSSGYRWRYVYDIGNSWIEPVVYEGNGTSVTLYSGLMSNYSDAVNYVNYINSIANSYLGPKGTDKYYMSASPNATIISVPVGSDSYITYSNKTTTPIEEQLYPIGKGWSWQLPYLKFADGRTYVHLDDGGTYLVENNQLKGYPWLGLSFTTDTSARVNGEASQYVLTSADGNHKQYFTSDGRLLEMTDAHQNTIQFAYTTNADYGRKLLSQITDAIGNSINITYSASTVTITNGKQTVTYQKHTEQGKEILDSVTDKAGRKTTYSYKLASAQFNLMGDYPDRALSNPYALLTKVQYPTGAISQYGFEPVPVKRYIGEKSYYEFYRLQSRYDQLLFADGHADTYNRKSFSYNNTDMGSSYNQDMSFSTTVDSGLTQTTYQYNKDYIDDSTPVQYYLSSQVETADGLVKTTSYTYGKKVGSNPYAAPTPTTVTSSNNQNSDILTTSDIYDDYGNVVSETDPRGSTTSYTYDDKHLLKSILKHVDQKTAQFTEYARNALGDVTQMTVRENDQNGALLEKVNYNGIDSYGNVTSQTIQNMSKSITTTFEYSSVYQYAFLTKQSVQVTDVDGNKTTIQNSAEYDRLSGNVTAWIDGKNNRTDYVYDPLGRVIQVTEPDNKTITANYDDIANTVVETNEVGNQTRTTWNGLGLKVEEGIFDSNGYKTKTRYGYDSNSRLLWTEDALGNRTNYAYDNWNRLKATTNADQSRSVSEYNDVMHTVTQKDGEGNIEIDSYDKLGQLIAVDEQNVGDTSSIRTQSYVYDPVSGKVLVQSDANQQATRYNYDQWGNLSSVTNAKNETTSYQYDWLGNQVLITNPDGSQIKKTYDELNRLILSQDKAGEVEKRYYDANNNLSKRIDRNGNPTVYQYDKHNRLIEQTSADEDISFDYDGAGKRLWMKDLTGTTHYTYDPYTGQLVEKTYPDGLKLTVNQFDANGNRLQVTDPFGGVIYYSYDTMDRIKTVGTDSLHPDATYAYSANGFLKQSALADGLFNYYSYSGNQLVELKQSNAIETVNHYQYDYDANKNLRTRVQNGSTDTFTYDELNRIQTSSPFEESYVYDLQGNRQTLDTLQIPIVQDTTNGYNIEDQLTQVTTNGNTVDYRYDGDGFLVERTQNGVTTRYYYDGDQIIAEATVVNGTPQLKARYIRGNQLEAIQYQNGSKAYVSYNGHGDVVELRDQNGTLLNSYAYDIWGNPTSEEEKVYNPFRYSGELWDSSAHLQYLRARWYDPSVGRFINEDTYQGRFEDPLSLNLYTYVENNPLIHDDPTGHWCTSANGKYTHPGSSDKCSTGSTYEADYLHDGDIMLNNGKPAGIYHYVDGGHEDNTWTGMLFDTIVTGGLGIERSVIKDLAGAAKDGFAQIGKSLIKDTVEGCNCFVKGTKVLTDDGEKDIADIKVGDKVLSKDETTGEVGYKEVTATFNHETDEIYNIHVGGQTIESTYNHPFYVKGKGWTFVKDLKSGDMLVQSDGNTLKINSIEPEHKHVTVYNMTVNEFHTYFVSDLGIWVHNTGPCGLSAKTLATMGKTSKGIAGLEDSYISRDKVLDIVKEFVGDGYSTGVAKNGYTTFVSKDGKYVARYGYKKDGSLELNLENDVGGNFHIEVK